MASNQTGGSGNVAAYMLSTMAKIAEKLDLGNSMYMGGELILAAGETNTLTIKAKASRDIKIHMISCSIDGTPVDRMDVMQDDIHLVGLEFTSELTDDSNQHVIDGELPVGDVFGRDTREPVVDIVTRNEEIVFQFRNTDPLHGHRVNVSINGSLYPARLSGLSKISKDKEDMLRAEE
jgi:hypothetical protein